MKKLLHIGLTVFLFSVMLTLTGQSALSRAQTKKSPGQLKAGLAKVVITPEKAIWMAGYAQRNKPSEGKVHDLFAKALALEDVKGNRIVIVSAEVIGLPRSIAEPLAQRIQKQYGLSRSQILLASTHTHTGPVLQHSLIGSYELDAAQTLLVEEYSHKLKDKIVALVGSALRDLAPAKLTFGSATATFGVNRRVSTSSGVKFGVNKEGPVETDVPVLRVESLNGSLRGILFGYACHNTTFKGDFYQLSGDYAGFAAAELERLHPSATALFIMGCGADIDPQPRGALEHARMHGEALAHAVSELPANSLAPVRGPLKVAFSRLMLSLTTPGREEFQSRLSDSNVFRKRHAERMLARLDRTGTFVSEIPYPIQVFQLGNDLTLVALAGEVVVDYALRLKRELGANRLWISAYGNDVPAYIPSERVLREGGYEADYSMIYYDLPGPFAPAIEEKIIGKVNELVRQVRTKKNRVAAK